MRPWRHTGAILVAAEKLSPGSRTLAGAAAPHLHLAHLYLEWGRRPGPGSLSEGPGLDPSYRTALQQRRAMVLRRGHAFGKPRQEHRRTLTLDPEDAYAHLGWGAWPPRRNVGGSGSWLRQALALDPNLVDAYRTLGKVQARLGRVEAAIAAYEKSLILALRGYKPLTDYIATEYQGLGRPGPFHDSWASGSVV